jgi:hypothetical protein
MSSARPRPIFAFFFGFAVLRAAIALGAETSTRVERTGNLRLRAPAARAFLLFTPDGERAWAGPAWNPQIVCSKSGQDEEGMVFQNGRDKALWIVSRLDSAARVIEYVIVRDDVYTILRCEVADGGQKGALATVTYRWISRTLAGNEMAKSHDLHFTPMLAGWERAMNAVLEREETPARR